LAGAATTTEPILPEIVSIFLVGHEQDRPRATVAIPSDLILLRLEQISSAFDFLGLTHDCTTRKDGATLPQVIGRPANSANANPVFHSGYSV
jgi:hypothetical protein